MSDKCPVCKSNVPNAPGTFQSSALGVHGDTYSCPRCGDYRLESFASAQLDSVLGTDEKVAVLSHWIRTKHEAMKRNESRSERIILTPDLVDNIVRQSPPSCAEQADKFIFWFGNSKHLPGELALVKPATHQSIMGAVTPKGFKLVLDHLLKSGLLGPVPSSEADGHAMVMLTVQGWEHCERLRRGAIDSRKAFMAMEYGDAPLDKIVDGVFKPAVEQAGFGLFRLPDRPQPAGLIDDRLRVEIRTSRFLVADLTHGNAGAYWEAGYAEGLGKPVIYTCEKKVFEDAQSKPHFDTNHHLTVLWEASNPENAAKELKATIRATLPTEAKLTDD